MKTYNKLVRDRIPEIILASGKLPVSRAMEDEESRIPRMSLQSRC